MLKVGCPAITFNSETKRQKLMMIARDVRFAAGLSQAGNVHKGGSSIVTKVYYLWESADREL